MFNTKIRFLFLAFLKVAAGAGLKRQLRLSAPTDQIIESDTGSGAALKMAAPAPQQCKTGQFR